MSSGEFINSLYEADNGNRHPIRLQPETLVGFNVPVAGVADSKISAIANGGRRRLGLNARRVRIKFQGTPPDGYKQDGVLSLPVVQKSVFDDLTKGDVVTYLGQPCEVLGTTPEYVN